jgi:PAS domain S-box-containing protein
VGSYGFVMDVTERKESEEALRESERQYRILSEVMEIERAKLTATIDSLPVGIRITDTQDRTLSMNAAGLRLHGFESLPELLTRQEPYSELFELRTLDGTPVPPEAWPSARAARGEHVREQALRLRNRRIGRERIVAYSAIPVGSPTDETRLLLYVMEDITERKRAEEQLQRSVAQFEALFNQMTEGLVLFDPEGHLLDMNPAALTIHGFKSVESLQCHLDDLTDVFELFDLEGDFLPTAEWPIGRVLRGESFDAYEVRVRRLDTGRSWIGSYGGTPVYGPEGELLLAIVTLRDVTAQREIEEALRRYTERLRFLHEVDEAILSARSAQEVAEAVVGRVSELLPDCLRASVVLNHLETDELSLLAAFSRSEESELRSGWRGPADRAWNGVLEELREGHTHVVEDLQALPSSSSLMEALQKEGVRAQVYVPLLIHDEFVGTLNLSMSRPGEISSDQLEAVNELAVQLSIGLEQARLHEEVQRYTEELEALVEQRTAELQAQYAQLEAVLRTTADGFVITDLSGAILHRNPIAQTWLEQVLPASDGARLEEAVRGLALRAESHPDVVLELTGLDLHLKAAPLDRSNGNAGVVVALQDVSSLKGLERMRSQFITDVSHELRTPVTTIALYAQLLEQSPGEKRAQHLAALQTESQQLGALIEEIVYFSRITGGHLELSQQRVDLAEVVQGVLTEYRGRVAERGVALNFATSEPSPTVSADRENLERVFHNLVDNATRYTTEGTILVNVTTAEWSGETWAMVSVADTGSGIAPEELPHIFERFFRGASAHRQQLSGTGLGLAVAKELVELHGGWITVESQVDEGSTFTVWLPLAP